MIHLLKSKNSNFSREMNDHWLTRLQFLDGSWHNTLEWRGARTEDDIELILIFLVLVYKC